MTSGQMALLPSSSQDSLFYVEEELARLSEPYVVNNINERVILFSRHSKADTHMD